MKTQPRGPMVGTASPEKTASTWNQWSLNGSPISRPVRPRKSQPHSQPQARSQTQPYVQPQRPSQTQPPTHASLLTWPSMTHESTQLPTSPPWLVGGSDPSVHNPGIGGGSHSVPGLDETTSHDYFGSPGGSWRSQMTFGLFDKVSTFDTVQLEIHVTIETRTRG